MKSNDKRCKRELTSFGKQLAFLMKLYEETYVDIYKLLSPDKCVFEGDDDKAFKNNCLVRVRDRMTGKVKISVEELILLAEHYHVSIDFLLDRKDSNTGLSAEAIQVLRDVPDASKGALSRVLENQECMNQIAATAHTLLYLTHSYTNAYRRKEIAESKIDDDTDPEIVKHEQIMNAAKINSDGQIFRAVSALGDALRTLYPLEQAYLYPPDISK